MLVHCSVTDSIKFDGSHLYTWAEGDTVRVEFIVQESQIGRPRLKSEALDFKVHILNLPCERETSKHH